MRLRLPCLLLVSGSLLAASFAMAQGLPAGPKVTVSAVTQVAPTVPQYTRVDVPLLREATPKSSGGRVEFNLKSWPEMSVQGPEVIRLVRSGQVDLGAAPLTTVSGDVPILDGIDLAGLNAEMDQARKVAKALLVVANKDLEKIGVKLVAMYPFPAQVFFCRKPVAGLADLKGLKIRTNGPSASDAVNYLGGQPTAIAFGEVYTALERGTVDCAITGTGSGNSVKWYEVTTHLYTLTTAFSTSGYFVNLAWWNKLDPAVRTFLEKTFADLEDAQWKLGAEVSQDGIDCNIGNSAGCKINTLVKNKPMVQVKATDADRAKLREAFSVAVLPAWVKRCGARCGEIYNQAIAPISGVKYNP
jgi:TRAP-type C4-dicarboxylate transport system substrate-binding protein